MATRARDLDPLMTDNDLTPAEVRDRVTWLKDRAREGADALHARATTADAKKPKPTDASRIVRQPAIDVLAKAMTEAQRQDAITGLLDHYRIPWHHETDSRRSKAGFPDLCIFGRRVVFWELKTQRGRVTPEQNALL